MNRPTSPPSLLLVLVLLATLLAACGPAPTQTPAPTVVVEVKPTDTAAPTAEPTSTPLPTETPQPTDTPTPEPSPTPVARFESGPCRFDLPAGQKEAETVECGYLTVPEDRADPAGRTVKLAVAVFHPEGDPLPDPVFYLEGGPGGSVLELLNLTFDRLYKPVLAAGRDLVLFDQRGIGQSKPALDCHNIDELTLELLDNEMDGKELTDPEMEALIVEAMGACRADLAEVADLSDYHSAASAADVNDLRLALGYDKINLWGVSYGTRLALTVMRDYPEALRSVVLDSVYTPDVDLYAEAPANIARALDVLFQGCAADPACNAAYPDLRTVLFDTVSRLDETMARFQVMDSLTRTKYDAAMDGDNLLGLLVQALYDTEVIPSLPKFVYDVSKGDNQLAILLLGALVTVREAVSGGMQMSVQCHEELPFSSKDKVQAELDKYPELRGLFEYSEPGLTSFDQCADWDSGLAPAMENEAVRSDIPTLVMAGEYDPITPPAWARHAAETLPNSSVFEYPGVGHGASTVAGCPRDMMIAFLQDPSQAPDDACIAEMTPPQFVVPAEQGEIALVPFTSDQFGIQGVVPEGWGEPNPGVYARQSNAADLALIIEQAAPLTVDALLSLLAKQLGLDSIPDSTGERQANGFTWSLYEIEVQGFPVDMALTQADGGLALLVLLQSDRSEREWLYDAVYLPAIDAMQPLP